MWNDQTVVSFQHLFLFLSYIVIENCIKVKEHSIAKIHHSEENGLFHFGPEYGPDLHAVSKNS